MDKKWWLIIVVFVLAVVGYYIQFVSESTLLGPRGAVPINNLRLPPSFGIPPMSEGPVPIQVPINCCTDEQKALCYNTCVPSCYACVGPDGMLLDNCYCDPLSTLAYACGPDPGLYGSDGPDPPCNNDNGGCGGNDKACCGGEVFNPKYKACCGGKDVYSLSDDSVKCCNSGLLIRRPGCCGYYINCVESFGESRMRTNGYPTCNISMNPNTASCLGWSCNDGVIHTQEEIAEKAQSDTGKICSLCSLLHEYVHIQQQSTGRTIRLCQEEKDAGTAQKECLENFPGTCDEECQEKKAYVGRKIDFHSCVCSKPLATTPEGESYVPETVCNECMLKIVSSPDATPLEICNSYCRAYTSSSEPDYCETAFGGKTWDDFTLP